MASISPAAFPVADPAGGPPAPQHFHPPTPRELRAQAVHRLQIGILGLGSMLLLVGLANIIMDRARAGDEARGAAAAVATATATPRSGVDKPASDPLADMGVVPDLPGNGEPSAASAPPADPVP